MALQKMTAAGAFAASLARAKAPTGPARSGRPDDKLRAVPTQRSLAAGMTAIAQIDPKPKISGR